MGLPCAWAWADNGNEGAGGRMLCQPAVRLPLPEGASEARGGGEGAQREIKQKNSKRKANGNNHKREPGPRDAQRTIGGSHGREGRR